jgi:hypothetical protein
MYFNLDIAYVAKIQQYVQTIRLFRLEVVPVLKQDSIFPESVFTQLLDRDLRVMNQHFRL